ncbi:hypothetical protein SNOG_03881 [Parastagonospora nodorum SN15]|uniref:Uncharacterized protein n=1 Tax=Phaeosphaeria nodorum (strain SN15 / ATCC MYA-4574 / FGSC 10173) TaxID=321614 RepID=Q0UWI3_PHANO|nr:hypothetical protein SNOG_03881 [Parastagonospora nodorum SN15]EAT89086.2 hypothetical protein SNOG_03881 [Parastagonospora nodorum SN15]
MCFKETASPSSSPTTTLPTPSATNPASASQSSSCPAAPVQMDAGFNGSSFAAGFFPGLLIGALGTIGLMWAMKKRRESHNKERFSGDFGHVARQISDPIYDPQHAARTDFMRRGSRSAQPSPNSTADLVYNDKSNGQPVHGLTPRIKSMWDRTPKLNFGFNSGLPSNPAPPPPAIRAGNSQDPYTTPRHTPRRSTETIDVLMPAPSFLEPPKAHGMRENRFTSDTTNTTFTKLMERAGFDDEGRKEPPQHAGGALAATVKMKSVTRTTDADVLGSCFYVEVDWLDYVFVTSVVSGPPQFDAADFADERLTRRVELGSLLVTIVVLIVVVRVELLSLSSSWRLSTAIERESFDQLKDLARTTGRLVGTMTIAVLVAAMLVGVGVGVRADGVAELNGATGAAQDAGAGL